MNISLYHAALEYRGGIDPEVVMPSVSRKTCKATQRTNKAFAEPSEI